MVNLMLTCGRCLKSELLRSEKTARFLHGHASKKVEIPPRIDRGPLDILRALANTVQQESKISEYRYEYGGLFSNKFHFYRRSGALSMDAGRRAAKWVVSQNPRLFQHKYAEPYIKAYAPPMKIDENTEVSEEILITAIEDVRVEEAIKLYKLMKEKNIDVSPETKQILLELVCFFNCANKPDEELIETTYYDNPNNVLINNWEKDNFAEELFSEMEPNSESYSALILGKFKHNNIMNAKQLFDEAREKQIEFGVEVYNAILENVTNFKFDHPAQEEDIIKILTEMKDKSIVPNQGTLNSVLKSVCKMKKWIKARSLGLKVYNEFMSLGIEPSLATYYYLLELFTDRQRVNSAFAEILDRVEKKTFVPSHPDDFNFFHNAMSTALFNYKSVSLAQRVHKILMTGCNRYFLIGNMNRTIYYRCYITAFFRFGNMSKAVDVLEKCIPQGYVPEVIGILIILDNMASKEGWKFFPRVWPLIDGVAPFSDKAHPLILSILVQGMNSPNSEYFLDTARILWARAVEKPAILRNSSVLSAYLKVFSLGRDMDLSHKVFAHAVVLGLQLVELDFQSLALYVHLCTTVKDKKKALGCIEYAFKVKHKNAISLATAVKSNFELNELDNKFLDDLLKKHEKKNKPEEGESPSPD